MLLTLLVQSAMPSWSDTPFLCSLEPFKSPRVVPVLTAAHLAVFWELWVLTGLWTAA